jgi:hypothetical protein
VGSCGSWSAEASRPLGRARDRGARRNHPSVRRHSFVLNSGSEERSARCETIDLPREGTERNEASCPAEQGSDRLVERATTASAGRRGCSGPMSRRSRRAIANTRAMFEGKGWT